jgi:hypothetical protein
VQVENGKFVPVFDEGGAKPWVCFDGVLSPGEWKDPVNVSFAGEEPISYDEVAGSTSSTTSK